VAAGRESKRATAGGLFLAFHLRKKAYLYTWGCQVGHSYTRNHSWDNAGHSLTTRRSAAEPRPIKPNDFAPFMPQWEDSEPLEAPLNSRPRCERERSAGKRAQLGLALLTPRVTGCYRQWAGQRFLRGERARWCDERARGRGAGRR
jgi:hypothetical protein